MAKMGQDGGIFGLLVLVYLLNRRLRIQWLLNLNLLLRRLHLKSRLVLFRSHLHHQQHLH
ncbi:hypothetical protein DL95DRAFT_390733, partial [Leptodontidium sp. 2 PMI_412]